MSFINGFFLINFLPLGILVIVGFVFFFSGKFKIEKWRHPLLFIFLVLAAVSAWRIPIIYDRRYAMPALVPSIVISVFALMLLPEILKRFKVPYDKAITRTAIAILLIACVAKTMRVQENKDYLHDIAEAIKLDCKKNNINTYVALLVFGNTGGSLELDNNVKVIEKNGYYDVLTIQYPHLYILCSEPVSGSFGVIWKREHNDNPELIFEYINRKQTAYRLYRVSSPHKIAGMTTDELGLMLEKKNSLFPNSDLKKKYRISPQSNIAQILRSRGIDLFKNGEVYIPEGWVINPDDGWTTNCNPVSIKFTESDHNALNVQSNDIISIYSNDALDCNKTYLIAVDAKSDTSGCLQLVAYTYTSSGKFIQKIALKEIGLDNKSNRYMIPLRLRHCNKIKLALNASGDVTIFNVKVVLGEIPQVPVPGKLLE